MTKRITCREYCICWNSIDKDCELFGEYHPCPRKCKHFLETHIINGNKVKNKMTWNSFCEKYNFGGRESFSYDNYIFCSDGSIWFSKEDNRWRVEENQTPEQMDFFIEKLKMEKNQ